MKPTSTSPTRTLRILSAAAVLLLATGCGRERPPDILLVTVDTLRADHLGVYGYERDTSPHLDAWAEQAVVFDNAYSTSSWTVPSMASMITGVEPPSHGVQHGTVREGVVLEQEVLPAALPTLAEELARAGYRTLGVSANTHLSEPFGFARGFERFAALRFDEPADRVNAQLLAWQDVLEDDSRPLFVWLHYCDPHFPYLRNEPFFTRWDPGATPEQLELLGRIRELWPLPPEVMAAPQHFLAIGLALYDSEIAHWDRELAALLQRAPRLARAHTLVAADHGEEFLDHGGTSHGQNLYNETVRVPMLLRTPAAAPARVAAPVSLLDVPVTLLRWAGAEAPAHWTGRELPLVEPAEAGSERELLAHLEPGLRRHNRMQALIGPRFKLIASERAIPLELFDLEADPGERRNLVSRAGPQAERLQEQLVRRLEALPAPPGEPVRVTVDPETERQLRALGYVGG